MAVRDCTPKQSAQVGRQQERKRLELEHSTQARKSALAEHGLLDNSPACADDHDSVCVADSAFDEVPAHALRPLESSAMGPVD